MAANDNLKPEIPVISLDSSGDEAVKNDPNEVSEIEIRGEEEDQNKDEDKVFNSVKSNGGCWVIEEPEKMEANEKSKPEIPVISLDSCDDEAMKTVRHEGSERESREAEEEEQNEGKVFNTGISNGGGGVKEEYVYRTKAEERKMLADLSSFPQFAAMLAFEARMRKKSRRRNRKKRRKKQQKIESVGSNAMTHTVEEEKQMDSNTDAKTKTSLETQLVKKKGDMVLQKLPRRYELHICNKKGCLTKDFPEKDAAEDQSLIICLRCGDSGHDMFSCTNEYSSDVKNDQNERLEREIREEEEQNEDKVLNSVISNGGCWVIEEPEKMAANESTKPEIRAISLDSSGDEAVKNDRNEGSERESREAEEDQNEGKVFNTVISNGGGGVKEEYVYRTKSEERKVLADLSSFPQLTAMLAFEARMRKKSRRGNRNKRRKKQQMTESVRPNAMVEETGRITEVLETKPAMVSENDGSQRPPTHTVEEEKQMDSNTDAKTKTSLETQLVKKKGDMRDPRYFDSPESSWGMCYNCGEDDHTAAYCTMRKRKKPCYICSLRNYFRQYELHICNKKGCLTKDFPEKDAAEDQSLIICLRCGDSGHDMFSCTNEYSSDVKNDQNERLEREIREEEEQNEDKVLNSVISNGGCWVIEEPEKMAANENTKPEIRAISLDSSGDEAVKNDRNEGSERESREAEEDQNEGKVFNTVISNGGGGVKEEYVYRTKSEERKMLADLSSFPQLTAMLAFEARMRKTSRRGNRNKRRKKQQMTESVRPNAMVEETGRITEVLETKPAMVSENDGSQRPPTHTVEEEKQMNSNTDAKTKTSLEMQLIKRKDNMVLRKLLRGPRYFDSPESSWGMCYNCGEDDHTTANCTMRKRKKPCYICGGFKHNAKHCKQRDGLYIYNRKGCLTKVCPEKDAAEDQSLDICLRCGDSGHNMFSCSNEYSSDDLRQIQCYVCKDFGHLCCAEFMNKSPRQVSCYTCGQSGHLGSKCETVLRF